MECFMCGKNIPAGEIHYDTSFTKEKKNPDGSVEALDMVSLFICCTDCGDKDNTYYMFKKLCQEAGVT